MKIRLGWKGFLQPITSSSDAELALKNTYFQYKILFLYLFAQPRILFSRGLMNHHQISYVHNWYMLGWGWGRQGRWKVGDRYVSIQGGWRVLFLLFLGSKACKLFIFYIILSRLWKIMRFYYSDFNLIVLTHSRQFPTVQKRYKWSY